MKGEDEHMNTQLKVYFLEEIQRIKIEEAILNATSTAEDEILRLDDNEITELYHTFLEKRFIC